MAESDLRLRVLPNDLDFNLHMNNARYLALMDLGRLDLWRRAGLVRVILKHRIQAVVGSTNIRFKRALRPFQKFDLITSIKTWDERAIYMEQRFEDKDGLVANAIVRVVCLNSSGVMAPIEVLRLVDTELPSPEVSQELSSWIQYNRQ